MIYDEYNLNDLTTYQHLVTSHKKSSAPRRTDLLTDRQL